MEKITSRKNPLCIHMKKLGESRSYRYGCGQFLCDGAKLLEEAVNHGAGINAVLTASAIPFPLPLDTRVYYTGQSLLDSVSPLRNAQDLLFTCYIRKEKEAPLDAGTHILLDSLQDPGNVGTIIRAAFAHQRIFARVERIHFQPRRGETSGGERHRVRDEPGR